MFQFKNAAEKTQHEILDEVFKLQDDRHHYHELRRVAMTAGDNPPDHGAAIAMATKVIADLADPQYRKKVFGTPLIVAGNWTDHVSQAIYECYGRANDPQPFTMSIETQGNVMEVTALIDIPIKELTEEQTYHALASSVKFARDYFYEASYENILDFELGENLLQEVMRAERITLSIREDLNATWAATPRLKEFITHTPIERKATRVLLTEILSMAAAGNGGVSYLSSGQKKLIERKFAHSVLCDKLLGTAAAVDIIMRGKSFLNEKFQVDELISNSNQVDLLMADTSNLFVMNVESQFGKTRIVTELQKESSTPEVPVNYTSTKAWMLRDWELRELGMEQASPAEKAALDLLIIDACLQTHKHTCSGSPMIDILHASRECILDEITHFYRNQRVDVKIAIPGDVA